MAGQPIQSVVVNAPVRWFLFDLAKMPSENPPRNGMDSVSRGIVFLMETEHGTFPYCRGSGHTGDSALLRVGEKVWRCIEDNEGAWAWREPAKAVG